MAYPYVAYALQQLLPSVYTIIENHNLQQLVSLFAAPLWTAFQRADPNAPIHILNPWEWTDQDHVHQQFILTPAQWWEHLQRLNTSQYRFNTVFYNNVADLTASILEALGLSGTASWIDFLAQELGGRHPELSPNLTKSLTPPADVGRDTQTARRKVKNFYTNLDRFATAFVGSRGGRRSSKSTQKSISTASRDLEATLKRKGLTEEESSKRFKSYSQEGSCIKIYINCKEKEED